MPKSYFDKAGINENGVEKLDAHYDMRYAIKNLRQVDVMEDLPLQPVTIFIQQENFPNHIGIKWHLSQSPPVVWYTR